MKTVRSKVKIVSLFSGCGGLDLGFHKFNTEIIYAADNDKYATKIFKENLSDNAMLRDVTSEEFESDIRALKTCDIVLGGFPCQGFSKAGPKQELDPRNSLYLKMKNAIESLNPLVFVAENVDGLSQNFGGIFVQKIIDDFENLNYSVDFRIIDAASFGVPQHRRRIIFVGIKKSEKINFSWPKQTHAAVTRNGESKILRVFSGETLITPVTIKDAISDLINIETIAPDHHITKKWPEKYEHIFKAIGPSQKLCNVRHSKTSVYTWQIPAAFGKISERQVSILDTIARNRRHKIYGDIPNGNPLSKTQIESLSGLSLTNTEIDDLIKKNYLKQIDIRFDLKGAMFCSGLFKRPDWNSPAPTVLTNFHNPRYFLHPFQNRPFSLRECARLQSFPDSFLFCEGSGIPLEEGYRLVGNAVPPLLSEIIAKNVMEIFNESSLKIIGNKRENETLSVAF
ncbi:MAG: DNA cytosine methyltransferase [Oligoflexus sp.]|nr:DNA cytosine methyltransferase [Oligoflexus sp.]